MTKAVLWPFCFLFLLLMKLCSGVPCNGESYQKLKRQCTQALHQRVKEVQGDLTRNCRDFADYVVCVRDSWRISYCDNETALARHNDTLVEGMQKKYFRNCYNDTSAQRKECRPDKAFEKLLTCGNRFYDSAVHVSNKRSAISLPSLCPEVEKYGLCAYKSQQDANCSLGYQMVPHLKYIAEHIEQRYRLLCTALRRSAFQRGTTACDRQRFINDMFLCGYHFANVAEVVGGNPQEVCPYIEKYKECHNTSIQTYGCAPPDHLYQDAEKFFVLLTQKYNSTCGSQGIARNFPQASRLTLKDGAGYTCDGNRFIRYFFQCAAGFVNATGNSLKDMHYICRAVGIYRHCVNGARHATHCNTKMELNSHIAFMQNFILEQYEPMCAMKRGKTSGESDSKRAER
ncbi:uncharacterized protein LOC144113754 [Amblyomma americanum]